MRTISLNKTQLEDWRRVEPLQLWKREGFSCSVAVLSPVSVVDMGLAVFVSSNTHSEIKVLRGD